MIAIQGRKRVLITRVAPQVAGGKYPAKSAIQEPTTFSASVFTDGHDVVQAALLLRHKSEKQWKEIPMHFLHNDHWEYTWYPERTGFYAFQIAGWIDHYQTWQRGLLKKRQAGQDIAVELEIGLQLIEEASRRATAKDKVLLTNMLESLTQEGITEEETVQLTGSDALHAAMRRTRNKTLVTLSEQVLELEVEVKRAAFSTWYELFPRSASPDPERHGTFRDVIQLLPRIAWMGFDTLYLPPIHPIGEEKRKGKNNSLTATHEDPGSPWAIGNRRGGHKAIHPQLGTLADFKALIEAARTQGIEIAMDIAFQCAPDHPYVQEHPEWFQWRPDGTVQYAENPPKKYEDILPFNFETEAWESLWQELRSVVLYWIEQGVRVFRVDNPHTKSFAFWEWMIRDVRSQYPEVLFLAEAFTRPRIMERLAMAGFNQSYTYFTWRITKKELQEYLTELTETDLRYYFRPNFWPNTPDILPPHLTQGGEAAHLIRLILAATMSSNYGLYGPVYEFGLTEPMPGKEEYIDNEKYEIRHWDWQTLTRIGEVMARVNQIRKANPALHTTWNIAFTETTNEQIIAYTKVDERSGNKLLIIVNLDPLATQSASVLVPVKELGIDPERPYQMTDLLGDEIYTWQGHWNYVELRPYEMPAHIFSISQNR